MSTDNAQVERISFTEAQIRKLNRIKSSVEALQNEYQSFVNYLVDEHGVEGEGWRLAENGTAFERRTASAQSPTDEVSEPVNNTEYTNGDMRELEPVAELMQE